MKWYLLLGLLIVVGCTTQAPCPECNCVCETAECQACPEPDPCPEPAPCEVCKVTTVTKYVCEDGRVLDTKEGCAIPEDIPFTPNTTAEIGSHIEQTTVDPACIYGEPGGTIFFATDTIASPVEFQIKTDPDADFETIHTMDNAYEGRRTFAITEPGVKWSDADFEIQVDRIYLFRLKFILPAFNLTQYSNEHILDLRVDSEYMQNKCSSGW